MRIMKIRAWDWVARICAEREDKFYHRDMLIDRIPETFEDLLQTIRLGKITGDWEGKEHIESDVKEDIIRKLKVIEKGLTKSNPGHWEFDYGYKSYMTIDVD